MAKVEFRQDGNQGVKLRGPQSTSRWPIRNIWDKTSKTLSHDSVEESPHYIMLLHSAKLSQNKP